MTPLPGRGGRRLLVLALSTLAFTACSYARPAPPAVAGPATWWLDPAFDPPGAETIDLPILVEEHACASGRSAEGRIARPMIEFGPHAVRITIGVFPAPGDVQTCQGNPATPFVVVLPEPLGTRGIVGDVPPPR